MTNEIKIFNRKYVLTKCAFVAVLVCALLFSLTACSIYYDYEQYECFGIGFSAREKNAFVAECAWNGDGADTTFVIPDEYKGVKVRELGGYFGRGVPCTFYVEIRDKCMGYDINYAASDIEVGDDYETLVFTIVFGKNISKIVRTEGKLYYGQYIENEDGTTTSDVLFKVVYRFDVDEENTTFYSSDGRLYYKDSNELVDCFFYE